MYRDKLVGVIVLILLLSINGCSLTTGDPKPRLAMFVGVDISGSFMNGEYFDDSIDFLAHYLYCHLNGLGDLDVPSALFVSSIGGAHANEPKTFFPIQTFENKSVAEITTELRKIFPKENPNPFTDYNAFLEQIAVMVKNKNLALRPISIVMISDGIPDVVRSGKTDYRSIVVKPLEKLSRSVTIRLLYTDATVGKNWQTRVPRSRVKIWTQDASVLATWKDPKILDPDAPLAKQERFFEWVKDNIDFNVRSKRIG
jgi:hypothetical protein